MKHEEKTKIRIALAGNPNCGKTTLFNELTGSDQYVGNWPGVTVEKKDGLLKGRGDVVIQDLPGIYSLSPYSIEEKIARQYLVEDRPAAILNIVDGTNIERNLYLSTQLAELGIPMVVAVNMMDVVEKRGDKIDFDRIAKSLRCKVVGITAAKGEGCIEAAMAAVERAGAADRRAEAPHVFNGSVEHALAHIEESIEGLVPKSAIRWYAIKIFEHDRDTINSLKIGVGDLKHIHDHICDCERELGDDAESIITNERYQFISKLLDKALARGERRGARATLSDRIDRIVVNRFLAIPVFVLAMTAMYWVAVAENGPGTVFTDWANDCLLGEEGWTLPFTGWHIPGVAALAASLCSRFDIAAGSFAHALLNDGVVGGVCTILGFVPVIAVVFLFLSFLEDCGYMARVAFIMDRIFRKFGLSGKSFVPMIVGKGCGVPAVYAARAIENERDRRMTIILATFMPCGAKTVIITMFANVFFKEHWWIAALMDLLGIAIVVLGGIALKKTRPFAGEAAPFIMELPAYHLPTVKGVAIHAWERVKAYVLKAGIVIFPCCVVLTFLMTFGWDLSPVGEDGFGGSMLAGIGNAIAWIFAPLGFGTWQGAAASLSAEIAKEQATATLAMAAGGDGGVYALFESFGPYVKSSALAFLVFNLFVPPCIVAVVATFKEMGKASWGWLAVGFQLFVGYVLALNAFQMGRLIADGTFGLWTAVTILVDLFCLWAIFRPGKKAGA